MKASLFRKRTYFAVLLGGLVLLGWWAISYLYEARQAGHAKFTMTEMLRLQGLIEVTKPLPPTGANLDATVGLYGVQLPKIDAWGHPYLLEPETRTDGSVGYVIISTGRDGIRGTCCNLNIQDDWDGDGVLGEEGWRQLWGRKR